MPTPATTDLLRARELLRGGQLDAAVALLRPLQQHAPQEPAIWQMLGYVELLRGRLAEAEADLRQALALNPQLPQTWVQLALVLRRQVRSSEAAECARQAVALDRQNASGWARLGECLADQSHWSEAAQAFGEALGCNPNDAAVWLQLALAEQNQDHWGAALAALARCVALAPDNDEAAALYGNLLSQRGRAKQAFQLLQDWLARRPGCGGVWFVFGLACEQIAELQQAERAQRQALALAPDAKAARSAKTALARLIHAQTRVVEAEQLVRQLLAEDATDAEAWLLLARIQQAHSEPDAALESLRQAQSLAPGATAHVTLILGQQYAGEPTAQALLAEHRAWDVAYARPLLPAKPLRRTQPPGDRRLRLGFLSTDFGQHPIGFLTLRAIELLDREQFTIACYSDRRLEDDYTRRFRAAADNWQSAIGHTDEELAEQIRTDDIDVLFDLSGFTGCRLLTLARKPAAVQIAWLGYPGTTGLSAMDYLLADRFHVPEGDEAFYAEKVLRLPHCYTCYEPPEDAPLVGKLPALAADAVTFGCLSNPCKFSPRIIDAWGAILRRLPTARLVLKFSWLGEQEVQAALRAKFSARGVRAEQVLIEDAAAHREFLSTYQRIDLALDTQPYSGGLTTCEALWMGVPVVTCPGNTFAGRHAFSYLSNAGLPQFVARDLNEYVELAVQWAGRLDELAAIRAGLRQQMRRSPLCDAPQFARDLEAMLLEAWRSKTSS